MKLLGFLLLLAVGVSTAEKIVCYFSSWAVYRPGDGKYDVNDIDPHLCTHLIFSFSGLSNYTWQIEVLDPWNELCPYEPGGNNCAYQRFVHLKEINPKLTVLLAIGGWNEGSEDYSRMAEDPQKRAIFIKSTVNLLRTQNFDGLDFDWEYPTDRGGAPQDKANFITLLTELRKAFDETTPPMILTAAVAAGKPTIDAAYDIQSLAPLVDQLHVMTYDYHGCFENFTHHNAPLCGYYADTGEYAYFNVNFTISYYLQLGVPKEKLVLGTALYGRCYTLDNFEDHGMLAPAGTCGAAGPYVRIPGTMAANEICLRLKKDRSCHVVHDPYLHEPYFYCESDYLWCGYDDADSLYLKARYAKNMGLAGVIVWTMDEDDIDGRCYDEPSHLVKVMKEALAKPAGGDVLKCDEIPPGPTTSTELPPTTEPSTTIPPTTEPPTTIPPTTEPPPTIPPTTEPPTTIPPTTEPPTTIPPTTEPPTTIQPTTEPPTTIPPTTEPPTTIPPTTTPEPPTTMSEPTTVPIVSTTPHGGRPDCTGLPEGTTFPHLDCDKFWECQYGEPILMKCAPGTLYDEDLLICNWKEEVETSHCRLWECSVEGTMFPAPNCDQYYECVHQAPEPRNCSFPLYWHQTIVNCDLRTHVDISLCNPV